MEKDIKNAMALGNRSVSFQSNDPSGDGRYPQLFAWETASFYSMQAPLSTDYFTCSCQGLDPNDFYAYKTCNIRMSDILNPSTGDARTEDYKNAIWTDPPYGYIGLGAKVNVGQNIYLVSNPSNQSSVLASAVLRRCNTYYNFLDYYGNILQEPFVWAKENLQATQNQYQDNMVLVNGHQRCLMQLNENTQGLSHNTRMILGNQAFHVTGLVNFLQEFTQDGTSNHLMVFDLYQVEPDATDDMENHVAGGLAFSWDILVNGSPNMTVNTTQTLTASSLRNGEAPSQPVSYTWSSNNDQVATITESGEVTAVGNGECVITCSLVQNPSIQENFALSVSNEQTGYVSFVTQIPTYLSQFSSASVTAQIYGENTQTVTWSTSGPAQSAYDAQIDGNTLTITCYEPSAVPLMIEAYYNGEKATAQILLQGY